MLYTMKFEILNIAYMYLPTPPHIQVYFFSAEFNSLNTEISFY